MDGRRHTANSGGTRFTDFAVNDQPVERKKKPRKFKADTVQQFNFINYTIRKYYERF